MATQVKLTVCPGTARTDSCGGVTTCGGTARGTESAPAEGPASAPASTAPRCSTPCPQVPLTAADLVGAVGAVGLLVAMVAGGDAGTTDHAAELVRAAGHAGHLGGCGDIGRQAVLCHTPPRPVPHSRQPVSSEPSPQSLSPSQRHSFRAQCPLRHLNSLGSQGDGVPEVGGKGAQHPQGRHRHPRSPATHRSPPHRCHRHSHALRRTGNRGAHSARRHRGSRRGGSREAAVGGGG